MEPLVTLSLLGTLATAGAQDDLGRAVDSLAAEALRAGVEVLVVVVDVEGERVLERGFGVDPGTGHRPDGETRFRAAPLFPGLLSIAALRLASEGRLDLDASLDAFYPELPYGELGVDVDQLLTHTSGIPSYGDLVRLGNEAPGANPARVLQWLRNGPLDAQPGACARYSATDDLLLGGVLARALETEEVAELLRTTVLEPAGMGDTAFDCDGPVPRGAPLEQEFGGVLEEQLDVHPPHGAAALCTSANDLVRLQRALADGDLLPESALALRATPPRTSDGLESACGRGVSLSRLAEFERQSLGGGFAGVRFQLSWYPALDATVVVWAAGDEAPVQRIGAGVARVLLALDAPAVRDLELTAERRAALVGDYYAGCTSHAVVADGEQLVLIRPEGERVPLAHQGGLVFLARDDPDVRVAFELDGERIVAFVLAEHGVSVRALRLY